MSSSSSLAVKDSEVCEIQEEFPLQKRSLTIFMNKKVPPVPLESERKPFPLINANIISRMFFYWATPVMKVGYKRTLQPADLGYLEGDLKVEHYHAMFHKHLERQTAEVRLEHSKLIEQKKLDNTYNSEEDDDVKFAKHTLLKAIFRTFAWDYFMSALLMNLGLVVAVLVPLVTKALINFVEKRALGYNAHIGKGIGYALGCSAMLAVQGMLQHHSLYYAMMVGAKCKAVLTKALLDKSLKLNSKGRASFPASKITSMMGTDLARIDLAAGMLPFLFAFPIPVIISIALLIVNIGVISLAGISVFVLIMTVLGVTVPLFFKLRTYITKYTDARVSYMRELLNNLKIIKFYCWEESYLKVITDIRTKETKAVYRLQVFRSGVFALAVALPSLASMVAFLSIFSVDGSKNPANVFASLTYFSLLAEQFFMIPMVLATGSDALVGLGRLTAILECGEVHPSNEGQIQEEADALEKENTAIKAEKANFEWRTFELSQDEKDVLENEKISTKKSNVGAIANEAVISITSGAGPEEGSNTFKGLSNIDLQIQKGEFVAVTGLIGSGKSSLLSALAGFMHKTSGSVMINGSLLLCGQPWVQNATVKENILFGSEYNAKAYRDVIYACSLDADLNILPAGDRTEIGERGITLSGGQKARINLARAVYANRDIILLDDVLSAVDARVGKHIVDECINGLLAHKTRILATHQLSLIGSADKIIFLNGDGSIDVGTMNELMIRNEGFRSLMAYNAELKEDEEDGDNIKEEEKELIRTQTLQDKEVRKNFELRKGDGGLMTKEERAVNQIGFKVYKRYISAGAGFLKGALIPIFLTTMALAAFLQLFTNTWLSFWTELKFAESKSFYMGIYIMITFLSVIFTTLQLVVIAHFCTTSSRVLNLKAVERVLKVPMSFMDTTPMGRILNRFTKDTDALDNEMNEQLSNFLYPLGTMVGVVILCIIYLPWFAIAVPFLVLAYGAISTFYQASGREVKRLEAIQRSFVYNNFNETLSGAATIKAYKAEQRFVDKNSNLLNKENEAYFVTIANQRWLAIHVIIMGAVFCLIICLLSVTRQFHISASSVGLLVSYILQVSGEASMLLRSMTQVENEMNSAERMCHYAYELEQEAPFEISETKPKPEWPDHGEVNFKDVSLSYRPGLPLVLKHVSFNVGAGEKIGICGRTGAGKSSIMTALFRISEMSEGTVIIDGVDISKIGLRDLRSKLSIIPQDPVLFRGSIRKNLDPFGEQTDEWLWQSLKKSGLIDDIEAAKGQKSELHKFHLDQVVEDDGANFSLGERQLIALARAVVRDSKILILDEATSSVDYETDSRIQSTIVKEFGHCTILCIAHRLKTIVDYDKILVLDKGKVKEFDTPWKLFNMDGGIFQSMCEKSQIVKEDFKRRD